MNHQCMKIQINFCNNDTFNSQNVVERAINSILNQTYQNIEFLILDDNSEDNTHNVLKNMKMKR